MESFIELQFPKGLITSSILQDRAVIVRFLVLKQNAFPPIGVRE